MCPWGFFFVWARGGGGALAPQLPRTIRVGPNQGQTKIGLVNVLGVYLPVLGVYLLHVLGVYP